jgi:hypothetical protein
VLDIVINIAGNDLLGNGRVFHFIYGSGFVFKFLIDLKEVGHFVEDVLRQLFDVVIHIVVRVIKRYSNDLIVSVAVIEHTDDTDGVALDEGEGDQGLRTKDENIEWVIIVGIGTGDEAVVRRVMSRSIENAVHSDQAGLLIELILDLTSLTDLNDCIEAVGTDPFGTDIVPDIDHDDTSAVVSIKS